jgi:hypothetical protein
MQRAKIIDKADAARLSLDVHDPVNDELTGIKLLLKSLDRQRAEIKQEVAFAASTPEWKGYDKEVVDAIASIEDQWLVSDEPITKTNVEKLHRFISETVVSIREKWVERLDKRERVWTAFPQKADIHDADLSALAARHRAGLLTATKSSAKEARELMESVLRIKQAEAHLDRELEAHSTRLPLDKRAQLIGALRALDSGIEHSLLDSLDAAGPDDHAVVRSLDRAEEQLNQLERVLKHDFGLVEPVGTAEQLPLPAFPQRRRR